MVNSKTKQQRKVAIKDFKLRRQEEFNNSIKAEEPRTRGVVLSAPPRARITTIVDRYQTTFDVPPSYTTQWVITSTDNE